MRVQEIQEHVRRRPFVPLRLFLSDGSGHDLIHPEFILITQREVIVATPTPGQEIPSRKVFIDPIHITRIEPIQGK